MATRENIKGESERRALELASAGSKVELSDSPAIAASIRPATTAVSARPAAISNSQTVVGAPLTVAAVAAKGRLASPRFTAEETILLRGLASGATSKEMAVQMRLPREHLYRLIGDLRRKTGATSDTALAVWVLRNMSSGAGERRGGAR